MYFSREFLYIFVYCFSCRYLVELGLRQLGLPVPNNSLNFERGISLSQSGSEGFRVRLSRLSEYSSVAYIVERPTLETQAEQYSDTVPFISSQSSKDCLEITVYRPSGVCQHSGGKVDSLERAMCFVHAVVS